MGLVTRYARTVGHFASRSLVGWALVCGGCERNEPIPDLPNASTPHLETATLRQAASFSRNPTEDDVDDSVLRFAGITTSPVWVGQAGHCSNATADRGRRMNVEFNVSDIPACATVSSATLTFHDTGCNTCQSAGSMSLVRIGTGWTESTAGAGCAGVTGATTGVLGAVGGFTGSGSSAVAVATLVPGATSSFAFDVTSDVQNWASTGTSNGWQLRFNGVGSTPACTDASGGSGGDWACAVGVRGSGCGGNKRLVFTRDDGTAANRPTLDVSYFLDNTNCNDGNACTDNVCTTLGCSFPANNALSCSDGIACTSDACSSGSCVSTPNNGACDDLNVCTNDACSTISGCTHTNNANPCSDGVACTQNDACSGGTCAGTLTNSLCPDDGNPCTTNTCTASGCTYPNNTLPCNDGVACTSSDTCNGSGSCVGTPSAALCNDGNACTTDTCSPGNPSANANGCIYGNNTLSCDDAVACTTGDTCGGGACAGTPSNALCNDSNDCTTDVCTAGAGCSHPALANGVACASDGNVCHKSTCQGGLCNTPDPGASCRAGVCTDGSPATAVVAAVCTAGGACPAQQIVSCGAQPCNASHTACQGACAVDTDCPSTFFCAAGGTCAAKLPAGGACLRPTMCAAGLFCTDGVCCTAACGNSDPNDCQACNAAGACVSQSGTTCQDGNACTTNDKCSAGTCIGGAALSCDDANPCTADGCNTVSGCTHAAGGKGLPCRASGGPCDVAEACDGVSSTCPPNGFLANTTPCRNASCTAGQQTLASNCPGNAATCPAAVTGACTPYICGASACKQTCGSDADCVAADYCNPAKNCVPKGQPGASCTTINQCASGECADGVCCDKACAGQCEACNVQGSVGVCKPVSGSPVLPRAACSSDGSACKGACNGVAPATCTYPVAATRCRPPSCAANVETLASVCNGTGSCPALKTQPCTPFVCGPTQCETTCVSDAQCQDGLYCAAGKCVPLVVRGTACARDSQCTTGVCVDGVCCNARCTGQCEACDVAGNAGTCSPVPSGAPHKARAACVTDATPCGGQCNGTSREACVYAGPGKQCRAPACAAGKATVESFCEGTGKCPPEETIDCKGPCVGSECGDECVTNDQCNLREFCLVGKCVPERSNGEICSSGEECNSSYCVDGICCDQACSGQCEACNVVGAEGTCSVVVGPPRGVRAPCVSVDKTCGGSCNGTKGDGCGYPGPETVCTPATCASGVATLAQTCAGDGSCGPLQDQVCAPYVCGGAKCAGNCTTDANCPGGDYCSAGVCVTKLLPGTPCANATQCGSNFCVDGVCCDKTCDRQCEACNAPSSVGRCVSVVGRPHGVRPTCGGTATCEGLCNGSDADRCRFPNNQTKCGEDFCASGVTRFAPTCNSAGTCIASDVQDCYPGACNQDGTACAATCTTVADCAKNLVCTSIGTCELPPPPDGGRPDAGGPDAHAPDAASGAGGAAGTGGGASTADASPSASGGRAGTERDAGRPPHDAGHDSGAQAFSGDKGSCGCRLGQAAAPQRARGHVWLVGIAALAWLTARRRRPLDVRRPRRAVHSARARRSRHRIP